MTDSLVEIKKEEVGSPREIQIVKASIGESDKSSTEILPTKDVDSGISSLIDPDEKPLPNCYIIDPGKVISRLSNGSHISKRLLPSDVYNFIRKYSNGHKILLSGTWLVRAFQDSLDFKQQEDALRKYLLVRDGIIKLEDEGGSAKVKVEDSKKQSGSNKHVRVEDPKKQKAAAQSEECPISAVQVKEEPSCSTETKNEDNKEGNAPEAGNDSEAVPPPVSSKRKARANSYDCNTCNFAAHSKRKREVDASSDDTEWTMDNACSNLSRRGRSKSAPSLEQADESDDEYFVRPKKGADKSCPFCCSIFSTMQSRKRHIMRMHPDRANDEVINLHMYRCKPTKELPFACDVCHKIFSNISSLHMHCKSIHEGRRDFTCTVCAKSYPRRCDLRKHVKRVHMKNLHA